MGADISLPESQVGTDNTDRLKKSGLEWVTHKMKWAAADAKTTTRATWWLGHTSHAWIQLQVGADTFVLKFSGPSGVSRGVTFGSEPWFKPEPTRTCPRFSPRFVSRVELNQWSGSRFGIASDYKNLFKPLIFRANIYCVIRHNLNFSLLFTLDCADHTCCVYSSFSPLFKVSITFLMSFQLPLFRLYYLETTDIFPTFFSSNTLII